MSNESTPYELHIIHVDDEWLVQENGEPASQNVYAERWEAEEHALDLAKAAGYGQIVVHAENGAVMKSYAYVPDVKTG